MDQWQQFVVTLGAAVALVLGIGRLGGNRIIRWVRSHAEADRVAEQRTSIRTELEPIVSQFESLAATVDNHTELDRQGFAAAQENDREIKEEILTRMESIAAGADQDRVTINSRLDHVDDRVAALENAENHTQSKLDDIASKLDSFITESRAEQAQIRAGGAEIVEYGAAERDRIWSAIEALGGQRPSDAV